MTTIVSTPRLIIRRFKPEEQEMYLGLFDDERVTRYLPVYSREKHIALFNASFENDPTADITGRWGIFNKADNDFIGICLMRPFDDGSDAVELGYVLSYKYWGKGIASELANALLKRALDLKPDTQFAAVTELDNIPSQKVLENAGLKRNGNYFRNSIELALFWIDKTE